MRGTDPWIWTYAKSQKVKNLERDDRATTLVESGNEYSELKGVMLKTRAHIERDTDMIIDFAEELFAKYQGTSPGAEGCATRCAARPPSAWRSASRSSRRSPGTTPSSAACTEPSPAAFRAPHRDSSIRWNRCKN